MLEKQQRPVAGPLWTRKREDWKCGQDEIVWSHEVTVGTVIAVSANVSLLPEEL